MAGNQPRHDTKQIRAIRELFRGRFSVNEVRTLYEMNRRDKHATVTYIFETPPQEISANIREAVNRIPERVMTTARKLQFDTEADQYACRACDNVWWRLSPYRKRVSKCNHCHRRFDMVDPEKWWGWAEFDCTNCHNTFFGWCHMQVASPCYRCSTLVKPTKIHPPKKKRGPRTLQKHSCNECLRFQGHFAMGMRGQHYPGGAPVMSRAGAGAHGFPQQQQRPCMCAHPGTRKRLGLPAVIDESAEHDSSGSTVDTFLPQGDLVKTYVDFDDLETIAEHGSDSDD